MTARDSVVIIQDNSISSRTVGILLSAYSYGQLTGNRLEHDATGISIDQSSHVNITANEISEGASAGISLRGSTSCVLTLNVVSSMGTGIEVDSSSDILISLNQFKDCHGEAVVVRSSRGITVHHNNLFMNNYQASTGTYLGPQALDNTTDGSWDDGREGNYWSDFQTRYPGAKRTGRIWDTPYGLAGSGVRADRFPLADPMDLLPPVAEAGPDQLVDQNTTVTLDGSASTDDAGIVDFSWDFDYGGMTIRLSGEVTGFTFDVPGTYHVRLTVRDREGRSSTDSATIIVLDTEPPVAVPGEDVFVGMGRPFTLNGSASRDNVGVVSYSWAVDPDGLNMTSQGFVAVFEIDAPGEYEAWLTVGDAAGNAGIGHLVVHVLDTEPPSADAGDDIIIGQDAAASFDGTGSSDNMAVVNWTWSLSIEGDEIELYGALASFIFTDPGSYEMVLQVRDAQGNSDQDTLNVRVRDTIPPVAVAGEDLFVGQGVEILFSGLASHDNVGISSYSWSFTDGGSVYQLSGPVVLTRFQDVGRHEVTLTVRDMEGNAASDRLNVTVMDSIPPVAVAGEDMLVSQGSLVRFDGSASTDNVAIVSYMWLFTELDARITLEGKTSEHTFNIPGIFRVILLVRDKEDNVGIDELLVSVSDSELPVAEAGPDQVAVEGQELTFNGTGSRDNVGIAVYRWTFEEVAGIDAILGPMPNLRFYRSGEFRVTLEVIDDAGNAAEDTLVVRILPLRVAWRIGPFVDGFGDPVPDTDITVLLNGTVGTGRTGADGWIELTVVRFDLVSPAEVSARKDGWRDLDFKLRLDAEGKPLDPIPKMEQEVAIRTGPSTVIWALVLAVLVVAIVCIMLGMRRLREGRRLKS
jgi:parallel beta-helix repeat protein